MKPNMSQNSYSPQNHLTPWQARTFLLFIILMLADLTITSYGFLHVPGFIEANPLYAQFAGFPVLFLNTIVWVKLGVIAGVLVMVQWFNDREPEGTPWHGGDVVCASATVGMAGLLAILLCGNLAIIL